MKTFFSPTNIDANMVMPSRAIYSMHIFLLFPLCKLLLTLDDREFLMPKTRSPELWEKAAEER
jgi:hypothetical protein